MISISKSLKTLGIFILIIPSLNAQSNISHEIISLFELAHIGQDFTLSYKVNLKKHSAILGLRYHQNTIIKDDQSHIFKNRFYAKNFQERIGLNLGYHYNFRLKYSSIHPFIFYNFQIARMGIKYSSYQTGSGSNLSNPINTYDQILGIGFNTQLYKKLFLYAHAGGGVVFYTNLSGFRSFSKYESELSTRLGVGLGWKIK